MTVSIISRGDFICNMPYTLPGMIEANRIGTNPPQCIPLSLLMRQTAGFYSHWMASGGWWISLVGEVSGGMRSHAKYGYRPRGAGTFIRDVPVCPPLLGQTLLISTAETELLDGGGGGVNNIPSWSISSWKNGQLSLIYDNSWFLVNWEVFGSSFYVSHRPPYI